MLLLSHLGWDEVTEPRVWEERSGEARALEPWTLRSGAKGGASEGAGRAPGGPRGLALDGSPAGDRKREAGGDWAGCFSVKNEAR